MSALLCDSRIRLARRTHSRDANAFVTMTPDATPSIHIPVLMREVLRGLELSAGLTVVDGTFGGGGHARKILEAIGPTGRLIGLDRDLDAIQRAHASPLPENLTVKQASYSELPAILTALQIESVDRILVDLGFSSDQLGTLSRGFGFLSESLLDLRFDYTQGVPAWQLLQSAPEPELRSIFDEFGEEPAARKLAAAIVAQRSQMQMISAKRFAEFVAATIGTSGSRERHPATRAFQALRIAVNRELEHLKTALEQSFPQALKAGGILAVITFHSLEDRLVKDAFKESDVWENLTPKPIGPTPAEERFNPRSRSAKLRLARRKP